MEFLKQIGLQDQTWMTSLANKKFVELPSDIRYFLENPHEVERCQICKGIILDEPHYDCLAEHKAIQTQEDHGDTEYFAPGGSAEEEAYFDQGGQGD